jgi:hypothetical protein
VFDVAYSRLYRTYKSSMMLYLKGEDVEVASEFVVGTCRKDAGRDGEHPPIPFLFFNLKDEFETLLSLVPHSHPCAHESLQVRQKPALSQSR